MNRSSREEPAAVSTLFILGGARSGKSRYAVASQPDDLSVVFVATAEARDADMAARIARHRAERPPHWTTVEEPYDLARRLARVPPGVEAVVVDCLTLWVANRQLRGDDDAAILADARALAAAIAAAPVNVTVVSNEVGEGVHPPTAEGLRFRDLLGLVNQVVAAACERVVLMVAGIPVAVKTPPPVPMDAP
ncbi:MAG: bifunctional adenosylcobinamide kinase/adenosylcobinamide-phosphate guanylyltransferase [Candidatus Rokubacteria bacterium]|nr:bifunctional adenosylcobinamide kinase/adenosylcobinamide-phosphate guanylyltransferase [Candidatus Rokubacteria bacterium]